jgi:hypothetical protein
VSSYAEAGSVCSRKLNYLDVTFLHINKTFPSQKIYIYQPVKFLCMLNL